MRDEKIDPHTEPVKSESEILPAKQLPPGWYPRRRGILEHLQSGLISLLDLAVHDFLCLTADHKTGLASSSAKKILELAPRRIDARDRPAASFERAIRRSLEHLEEIGWIKRWMTKGKTGNYPVLIARLYVQRTVHEELSASPRPVRDQSVSQSVTWWQVNADRTTDYKDIQYDPVREPNERHETAKQESAARQSAVQEVKQEETKKKDIKPKASLPPAITRLLSYLEEQIYDQLSGWRWHQGQTSPQLHAVHQWFKLECRVEGIEWRKAERFYNQAVAKVRKNLEPTETIQNTEPYTDAVLDAWPIDPDCTERFRETDGSLVFIYPYGMQIMRLGACEPDWFAFDDEALQERTIDVLPDNPEQLEHTGTSGTIEV